MVNGSGHQDPAPTAHLPPARGRAQQTTTYLGRSIPQLYTSALPLSDGRSNLSPIAVSKRSGLRFEMERWLEVRSRLNGAPWYDATRHVLAISGATDASSQARGGLIRGLFGAFPLSKQLRTSRQHDTTHISTSRRRSHYTKYPNW